MLIDWFTVGAQALNFIILVWLLKRFLYKPILNAIDAREEYTAKVLAEAAKTQQDADAAKTHWQTQNTEIETERNKLLADARTAAEQEKQNLLTQARSAADKLSAQRQTALVAEQQSLQANLTQYARTEVFAIANKALHDLANSSLEAAMFEGFKIQLAKLADSEQQTLAKALKDTQQQALIRSQFPLNETQQQQLRDQINTQLSIATTLQFETQPTASTGIALIAGDQKLAWTIDNYLLNFEQGVQDLLTQKLVSIKDDTVATDHDASAQASKDAS